MTDGYDAWLREHLQDKKTMRDHLEVALFVTKQSQFLCFQQG